MRSHLYADVFRWSTDVELLIINIAVAHIAEEREDM